MDLLSTTQYANLLIHAVLETDKQTIKPSVHKDRAVVRASGWLKGSDRTIFMAVFVYDERNALRVNIRSNRNGCFHYPPIPMTEMDSEKVDRLARIIISNVNNHFDSTK
jgi:hypothetical protein